MVSCEPKQVFGNHPRPNMSNFQWSKWSKWTSHFLPFSGFQNHVMFDSSKNPSDSYFWNRQSFADKNQQKGNWQELSCIGYEFVFACLPRLQGLIPAANPRRLRSFLG